MQIEFNGKKLMDDLARGKERMKRNSKRAFDRALSMGKSEMSRQLRTDYYLKVADINKAVKTRVVSELEGRLISSDKKISYGTERSGAGTKWRAKQMKRGVVQVYVRKRKPETFRHAFLATMPTGHQGLFERNTEKQKRKVKVYKGGKFAYNKILPIKEIKGPSITQLFSLAGRVAELKNYMIKKFYERLKHENSRK